MKRKQDIEKIFQDREHQLEERPSNRAWTRLESRLDGNRSIKRRPRPAFRIMSMAATLLFLVATIALMSTLFRTQNNQTASSAPLLDPPVMEELGDFDDQKGVYAIAVSFQRYLNQSPNVFAEGAQNKKLIPPSKVNSSPPEDKGFLATATVKKRNETLKEANEAVAEIKVAPTTPDASANYSFEAAPESIEPLAMADVAKNDVATYDVTPPKDFKTNAGASELPSSGAMAKKEKAEAELEKTNSYSRSRQAEKIELSGNVVTYEADLSLTGVEQFQWLIGQWVAPLGENRQTIEQWRQKDQFTIEGRGQLVVNGDTTFTEGMKIQKIGADLYYILALDENNKEVRFQLHSLEADRAVFQTDEQGVPNELIIQQYNFDNFSTTLQNVAPTEIEENQRNYLQNRNNIELNQRTVRNMSRVNKD